MTNTRFTESRNKREGWYCNKRLIEGFIVGTFHILHNKRTKIEDWSLRGKVKNLLGQDQP